MNPTISAETAANLHRLANRLDTLEHVCAIIGKFEGIYGDEQVAAGKAFNLCRWRWDCDTPACIAGHTIALFYDVEKIDGDYCWSEIREMARDALGISEEQAHALFSPRLYRTCSENVGPRHAADTVRNFADSGQVIWEYFV